MAYISLLDDPYFYWWFVDRLLQKVILILQGKILTVEIIQWGEGCCPSNSAYHMNGLGRVKVEPSSNSRHPRGKGVSSHAATHGSILGPGRLSHVVHHSPICLKKKVEPSCTVCRAKQMA